MHTCPNNRIACVCTWVCVYACTCIVFSLKAKLVPNVGILIIYSSIFHDKLLTLTFHLNPLMTSRICSVFYLKCPHLLLIGELIYIIQESSQMSTISWSLPKTVFLISRWRYSIFLSCFLFHYIYLIKFIFHNFHNKLRDWERQRYLPLHLV